MNYERWAGGLAKDKAASWIKKKERALRKKKHKKLENRRRKKIAADLLVAHTPMVASDAHCTDMQGTGAMTDKSKMPFGKHAGKLLEKVPEWYWKWFIEQEWAEYHEELLAYCEKRLGVKYNPVRKVRECVLTHLGTVTGPEYDPNANDGACPFDVD